MTEIKFRAWNSSISEMLEQPLDTVFGTSRLLGFAAANDAIIMQFTGLKDKTGREIYEGDIVSGKSGDGEVMTVAVKFVFGGFEPFTHYIRDCRIDEINCEVIGNIHEDMQLLHVSKGRDDVKN